MLSLVDTGPVVMEKKIFKIRQCICRNFVIITSWAFHLQHLNALHPKTCGSGEEDFFYFVKVFSLFRIYIPLEKGGALHLNKLESLSPKYALCEVWLNLAQWFWVEDI